MQEYKDLVIKCTKLEIEISKMPDETKKEELKALKEQLNILRKKKLENDIQNALNKMSERRNNK